MIVDKKERVKPEVKAHNTWGVGADDVMLIIKFPKEWEVKHSSSYMSESDTVYLDLSAADAKAFAMDILKAAFDAERIEQAYIEEEQNANGELLSTLLLF